MMRVAIVIFVVACVPAFPLAADQQVDADLIIVGRVYTLETETPRAQAVAMYHGRILYVGDVSGAKRLRGVSTRWIESEGAVIVPGLTDAHGHLANLGRYLANLKLVGTKSKEEVVALVKETQGGTPPGRWIRGRGWDQNDWDVEEFPTWRDLDDTDANPVYLRRIGGHAAWVNRAALVLAGITRETPDPRGGRIVRDDDGEATGILIDAATLLVSEKIPEPDDDELDAWMRSAIAHCNATGLTGVHDAGISGEHLASLERIARARGLSLRVYCMLESSFEELIDEHIARGPGVYAGGLVTTGAIKMYADGAMGSRGAALLEPYDDDPHNTGLVRTTYEDMVALSVRALRAGFQMCAHAIGDRANRMVLDAYEEALRAYPVEDHRFRIEHCQLIAPEDMERFARLGVIASMQPTHATSDMYWAEARVGAERLTGAYAWRTLLDQGARVALGSDFPVESVNPLWGMYAAVTRQDHDGWPVGGWYPVQRMTPLEALLGFTVDAAWARFAEEESGTIAVGKFADITVFDRDPLRSPPGELLDVRTLFTVVDGMVVYEGEPRDE
ncbi:MAG: amidohydrolase [Candidatus Krumholzibacteriota bacterium]|nr:amidohydrolase [Candidatus Krumholzibacteriota bacterium]